MTDGHFVFHRILHPTDLSRDSDVAFGHALQLTLRSQGALRIFHVDGHPERVAWSEFPGVRELLSRWQVLPPGAEKSAVAELGVDIEKTLVQASRPEKAIAEYMAAEPVDLIVLATHHRQGLDRWLHKSIATSISRKCRAATLFVPEGSDGFVAIENGEISLNRILLPVVDTPSPEPAVVAAATLARSYGGESVNFTLLHVGEKEQMPAPVLPSDMNWTWERVNRSGDVVPEILSAAQELRADALVLTTQGHHGFLDALRGSTTEQVLRGTQCPLLAVHAP